MFNRTEFLLVAVLIVAALIGLIVVTYRRRKSTASEQPHERQAEETPKQAGNTWRERYRVK